MPDFIIELLTHQNSRRVLIFVLACAGVLYVEAEFWIKIAVLGLAAIAIVCLSISPDKPEPPEPPKVENAKAEL